MEDLKHHNNELRKEIEVLNMKLEEALAGLQAATRLGDQVETKTAQINDLKEQGKDHKEVDKTTMWYGVEIRFLLIRF